MKAIQQVSTTIDRQVSNMELTTNAYNRQAELLSMQINHMAGMNGLR